MSKKYKFTGRLKEFNNIVVRQIYRLKDNKVGGWIEKEENLSHDGECWVSDNAVVFGNAVVSGDAEIFDNAKVFGNAKVFDNALVFGDAGVFGGAKILGNARVFGNARVYGNTRILGNAKVSGNTEILWDVLIIGKARISRTPITAFLGKHPILVDDNNLVTIGCKQHTLQEWLKRYKKIGKKYKYSEQDLKKYGAFLKFLKEVNHGRK